MLMRAEFSGFLAVELLVLVQPAGGACEIRVLCSTPFISFLFCAIGLVKKRAYATH